MKILTEMDKLMEEFIFILHIMRHREEFIIAMILQIRQNQKKGSQENYLYLHQGSSSIVSAQFVQTEKEHYIIRMTAVI